MTTRGLLPENSIQQEGPLELLQEAYCPNITDTKLVTTHNPFWGIEVSFYGGRLVWLPVYWEGSLYGASL